MRSISTDSIEGVVAPENYIKNGKFEKNVKGWVVSKNTSANAIPDSGFVTSGLTNTFLRSTSSPLSGDASAIFTLGALGNQVYVPFTINSKDQAKMIRGTFDYACTSYTSDTVAVWIYDVTNNVFTQTTPYLIKNHTLTSDQFAFEFQSAYNSTSYRLVLHQAAAGTGSLKIDNFVVGPQVARGYGNPNRGPVGSIIQHASLTPPSGYLYCDGSAISRTDYAELFAVIGTTYGSGNGSTTFNIPDGRGVFLRGAGSQTIGAETYSATLGTKQNDSFESHTHTGSTDSKNAPIWNEWFPGYANSSFGASGFNSVPSWATQSHTHSLNIDNTGDAETRPANLGVAYHICYTTAGSAIQSTDAANGVVAFYAQKYTGSFSSAGEQTVASWSAIKNDDVGAFDISTGIYTVKVPGYYRASASILASTGSFGYGNIRMGSQYFNLNANAISSPTILSGSAGKKLIAGDTIYVSVYSTVGGNYGTSDNHNYLNIELLQGPSQILASADVSASYYAPSGTLTNSWNTATFGTKIKDTHSAYSGGVYTIPISGTYDIFATAIINSVKPGSGSITGIGIFIDGTEELINLIYSDSAESQPRNPSVTLSAIPLLSGQSVTVRVYVDGTTTSFNANKSHSRFAIKKVGNY